MSGIEPRGLNNRELVRISADLAAEGELPHNFQMELIRRLNFYMHGAARADANPARNDPAQLELDLR